MTNSIGSAALTCPNCSQPFRPKRTAGRPQRFCSPGCRVTANNAYRNGRSKRIRSARATSVASQTNHAPGATSVAPRVKKLPRGIVADPKWPGMYRVRYPNGRLSDMVNLTRAKDALRP